ncbi:MAG: DUF4962 domain-containing protein [Victivallales bacterium]|nr:DUF4962 domain-containing protein [Victivallales bacterium]
MLSLHRNCCLGLALVLGTFVQAVPGDGELRLTKKAIHPVRRVDPSPAGGVAVSVNPPPLLWPAKRGAKTTYDVRLSQSGEFPKGGTIAAAGLRWAMFNAHQALAAGTWYWQYRIGGGEWSAVAEFRVGDGARLCVTPPAAELVARCPVSHPRVLVKADGWAAFRERVKGDPEARKMLRNAKRTLGAEPSTEESGKPTKQGKNEYQQRVLARWASKGLGGRVSGRVQTLCKAYVLTGDEKYAREAIRHGLSVAQFDPDGVTSLRVSDFGDGACLRALAYTYDTCYEFLTADEKAMLLKAIQARGSRLFNRYRNSIETTVFSAHVWQHILHEFADAAFATAHDLPEAEEWVRYLYELWLNRVPLMGGDDGGWANGNSYFGTNLRTLAYVPAFFRDLVGIDLMDQPWYRNTMYYQIYTWPPGSKCDGFGDGGEKLGGAAGTPIQQRYAFVDLLARHFGDAYGAWYVDRCFAATGERVFKEGSLAWYRLRFGDAMKPVAPVGQFDLPLARAFRDIGVVAMHTNLNDISGNLMVAFRSSPFGGYNHAHADQNSFNVLFGGQRLFANTGYYITYGDPHFKGWYTHTVGHNSVLIDGKGQKQGSTEAYGWIPRFLNGKTLAYCSGDASNAYPGTGLARFRRHMVLLRPGTVIVYDELEADHPAEWTWLLHADKRIREAGGMLSVQTPSAVATAQVQASAGLGWTIDSTFVPPADNWHGRKKKGGDVIEYPDQWHARAVTKGKAAGARFLAVLVVTGAGAEAVSARRDGAGALPVAGWSVKAELDPGRPAALAVRRDDGSSVLTLGHESVGLGGKTYRTNTPGATLLVELVDGEVSVKQAVDELPAAAR